MASNLIKPPSEDILLNYQNGKPLIVIYGEIENTTIMPIIDFLKFDFEFSGKRKNQVKALIFYATKDIRIIMPKLAYYEALRDGIITRKRNHSGILSLNKLMFDYDHNLTIGCEIDCKTKDEIRDSIFDDTPNVYHEDIAATSDSFDDFFKGVTELNTVEVNPDYREDWKGKSIKLFDIFGGFNESLGNALELVGLNDDVKDLIAKDRKKYMIDEGRINPTDFFYYAMGDVEKPWEGWKLRVEQINKIVENSLGIKPDFDFDYCPRSSGALVSTVMMMWLVKKYPLSVASTEFLAVPYGLKGETLHRKFLKVLESQKKNIKKGWFSFSGNNEDLSETIDLHKKWGEFGKGDGISGMARGSIGSLAGLPNNECSFNGVVMGGRCINDHPLEQTAKNCFDYDLKSAYGGVLAKSIFPIGRPRIERGLEHSLAKGKCLTLGEVMDKYIYPDSRYSESKFVPGLYQIIVKSPKDKKGKLVSFDFQQDLIFSKPNVTFDSIKRNIHGLKQGERFENLIDDEGIIIEKEHIEGEFVMLKREVINGIITANEIELIRKISNNKELSQWRSLEVITLSYYCPEDELLDDEDSTADEKFWQINNDLKARGRDKVVSKKDHTQSQDHRHTKWIRADVGEFVNGFLSYRKELKSKSKSPDYSKEDRSKYNTEQKAVKLFVNTLYGCFASPYFPISNAILANNITSKIRCGTWMMCKALGIRIGVTDGGFGSNSEIRFFKTGNSDFRKPSFNVFANYERLNKSRYVRTGELIPDFQTFYNAIAQNPKNIKKAHEVVDGKALEHVKQFWNTYEIDFDFQIETKETNTCMQAVYSNKSDYALVNPLVPEMTLAIENRAVQWAVSFGSDDVRGWGGETLDVTFRVRGARDDLHPRKMFLLYLADLIDLPNPHLWIETRVGFGEFVRDLNSVNRSAHSLNHEPFDTMHRQVELKPNVNYLTVDTYREYKTNRDYFLSATQKHLDYKREVDNGALFGLMGILPKKRNKASYVGHLTEGDCRVVRKMELARYGKNSSKITSKRFKSSE